jgi:hypothetical protein
LAGSARADISNPQHRCGDARADHTILLLGDDARSALLTGEMTNRPRRKDFFFEKKKQKTFMSLARIWAAAHASGKRCFVSFLL